MEVLHGSYHILDHFQKKKKKQHTVKSLKHSISTWFMCRN